MVSCPICNQAVKEADINRHIDSDCKLYLEDHSSTQATAQDASSLKNTKSAKAKDFFTPATQRNVSFRADEPSSPLTYSQPLSAKPPSTAPVQSTSTSFTTTTITSKRPHDDHDTHHPPPPSPQQPRKRPKPTHAPLAERMRPQTLDEVTGQDLLSPTGVLRNLILTSRVPSMILWGGPGTGKTTIARLIAQTAGTRFVEINSTSSGVAECKKIFAEARAEQALTGRRTIVFCDEIHRFSKSQQDVFLAPVEAGQVVLIGATTENPSFKVVSALLSRCRTFTLSKLSEEDILVILRRALIREGVGLLTPGSSPRGDDGLTVVKGEDREDAGQEKGQAGEHTGLRLLTDDDSELLRYLASFADGDARTALNLLELAIDLCKSPDITMDAIKESLTRTLVYDRAGDQHYDTISAFHKSVRGSNADAALYYLARMLQSGEDPLYIARRMVVIASEDVGLADNSLLSLATATYSAAEKIGMPECRINLAHCAVALCLAPKSVRAYRGLNAAYKVLSEPGVAGLPIPIHLRNAPTKLMKELGYGQEYKYNPDYLDGQVAQSYLPDRLKGRKFLQNEDLGQKIDPDLDSDRDNDESPDQPDTAEDDEVLLGPDGD